MNQRFSMRMIPITKTCYANMNDIKKMAVEILKPRFHLLKDNQQIQVKKFHSSIIFLIDLIYVIILFFSMPSFRISGTIVL